MNSASAYENLLPAEVSADMHIGGTSTGSIWNKVLPYHVHCTRRIIIYLQGKALIPFFVAYICATVTVVTAIALAYKVILFFDWNVLI